MNLELFSFFHIFIKLVPELYKLDKSSNDLSISLFFHTLLPRPTEITITKVGTPVSVIVVLAAVFVVGLFVVGYDQGHIFSIALGEQAFENLYIHELTHDMRHAQDFLVIR